MLPPSPHDPYRPPSWRWERARWLREHGKYARKGTDDQWTIKAKEFQTALAKCENEEDRERLSLRFPALYYAHDTYMHADNQDVRYTIEARTLANEKPADVARKSCTTELMVGWFEKLFFDVRPHLASVDYIINVVISKSVHDGLAGRDYDTLWKLFGRFGGPFTLDLIIDRFGDTGRPASHEEVRSFLRDHFQDAIMRKSAIAAEVLPLHNNFTLQIVLETHARLLEIEQAGDGGDTHNTMMEHIRCSLLALGTSQLYAGNKPNYAGVPRLEYYDSQAAELRAHEQIEVTLGRETEEHQLAVTAAFPEPAPAEPAGRVQ